MHKNAPVSATTAQNKQALARIPGIDRPPSQLLASFSLSGRRLFRHYKSALLILPGACS
jgi:hypothetical protein